MYLVIYHLALATIRYWNLFRSNFWRGNITLWMMIAVITQVVLCQRWIYNYEDDSDLNEMDDK